MSQCANTAEYLKPLKWIETWKRNGLNMPVKLLAKIIRTLIFKLWHETLYRSKYIFVFRTKYLRTNKRILNPFDHCYALGGSKYRPTFKQQYLKNGNSKECRQHFARTFDKLSNDIQIVRLCTWRYLVIDV